VNPPLVGGIAFTRQGRCQEREEVLGTTKPPYTLALAAALFRQAGCDVRLVDLTATAQSVADLIARLDAEHFQPTLIVFPSTTPTLDADVQAMAQLKAKYRAPLFTFGPQASCTPAEAMARAPEVDGMFVGEPEDGLLQLATLDSLDRLWHGDFATFWRAPAGYAGGAANGALTPWLAVQLAKVHGQTQPAADAASDAAAVKAQIQAFQSAQALKADGLAGPLTLMQLNRASGVDEPRLQPEP